MDPLPNSGIDQTEFTKTSSYRHGVIQLQGLLVDPQHIGNSYYQVGADVLEPDGEGYQFNSPETTSALNFVREMYDEGCAWLSDSQFPEDEFAARKGLFAIGSLSGTPSQEDAFADTSSNDEWTVLPFPSPKNERGIPVYGPAFQILETDPEKQLASWLAIKWFTSPENQARLAQASKLAPVRISSLEQLDRLTGTFPQWAKSVELLDQGNSEPPYKSWHIVRWAVSDAATQLYRSYFTIETKTIETSRAA